MALKQWDVVRIPAYLLGLPDDMETQYGVIVSSDALTKAADRFWILQVPNPVPSELRTGDVAVPELDRIMREGTFVVRAHTIFAVHELDVPGDSVGQLPKGYRSTIMKHINTFLPRGGRLMG